MDASTFVRSLFALRHYFPAIADAGARGAPFAELETLGLEAEHAMNRATGGVNTHRGAIFTLGLLCAAAGSLAGEGAPRQTGPLRERLRAQWGQALRDRQRHSQAAASHGRRAARRHDLRGASEEAAEGFPVLFETTWPALRAATQAGLDAPGARLQALMQTIAVLDDTNLAHRGGMTGLRWAQQQARAFLAAASVSPHQGRAYAWAMHRSFVARGLSPGGSADHLAAACWLQRWCCGA
jgi:triphosphoribosyl-dephospho-CoA synthase